MPFTINPFTGELDFSGNQQSGGTTSPPVVDGINVQTLTTNKQLLNTDVVYHDLRNNTASVLNVFMPTNPTLGRKFHFINSELSTQNISVDGNIMFPADRLLLVWNGSTWRAF